jgi:hypothetical protein
VVAGREGASSPSAGAFGALSFAEERDLVEEGWCVAECAGRSEDRCGAG